jgi:hypothetical protein
MSLLVGGAYRLRAAAQFPPKLVKRRDGWQARVLLPCVENSPSALFSQSMIIENSEIGFTLLGAVRQKNAGRNLDSGLEIEHDPCWRMIARVFLPTRPSVNTAVHEPVRQIR